MVKRGRIRRGIVLGLLVAMLLPLGAYAQTDGESTGDAAVQEESAETSVSPDSYKGSVSSSDSAGFPDEEETADTALEDDFEEELVGSGYELSTYLPYENAKYYLQYRIDYAGEVTVFSCSENESSTAEHYGDLVIPNEIEGHPVTKIGREAFSDCSDFDGRLILSENLTSIGAYAFKGCSGLKGSLTFPDTLVGIGELAFADCSGLTGDIRLPEGMNSIGNMAFWRCTGFNGKLILPDSLTNIGSGAFNSCSGLTGDLVLPAGLSTLNSNVFLNCTGFNGRLVLPDGLTSIGSSAFNSCCGLTGDLVLPAGLSTLGGAAFSFCNGFDGKLILPDSLTSIGSGAFYNCSGLTGSLVVPRGLAVIEDNTFENCSEIANVSIPVGITAVRANAFRGCCGLTNVYYEGGNWGAVTVESGNDYLQNAKIQCNSYYTADQMPQVPVEDEIPTAVLKPSGLSKPATTRQYDSQTYTVWSDTVKSYLYDNGNGVTRVEYDGGNVIIENYDSNLRYQEGWTLAPELPVWGGFYAGEKYNFIVFGQENPNEDDSVEVIRVVKYDKAWNRLGHASLKGANTTIPFRAGSLRCDEYGGMLYVHTCHQMYTSRHDGLRHQSNMTFSVREDDMRITDYRYDVSNISTGYVSHSFNQFLMVDGESSIVTLDHGDGAPRSAVLVRYEKKAGKNAFTGGQIASVNLIKFAGEYGDNHTNASVGGLAETDSGYIAAYNYLPGGGNGLRNIQISYVPKDSFTGASVITWTDPGAMGTTPVIASMGNEGGYVLWRSSLEKTSLQYVYYDARGNISQIETCDNALLSDCQPILYKGNLVWYASNGSSMTFYALNEGGISAYDPTDSGSVLQDPKQIRDFVKRLYTVCLGREYDEDGLRYWFRYLSSHTKTAAEVAQGFFFSDEFMDRNYSDKEYLSILYRTMFDREPGANEIGYWMERFENGMSRLFVYRGFAESTEFSDLCGRFGVIRGSVELTAYRDRNEGATGFIARLYTRMLGRTYEEDGLEYWCRAYLTGEKTIEDIASDGFLHSPELLNMNLPDDEFVARMYRTFLNREPEADGLAYWVDRLVTGQENRDTLVYGFTRSPEFAELKASYGL